MASRILSLTRRAARWVGGSPAKTWRIAMGMGASSFGVTQMGVR